MSLFKSPAVVLVFVLALFSGCTEIDHPPPATSDTPGAEVKTTPEDDGVLAPSVEQTTKVHRLASSKRAVFDAFTYVNRIPEEAEQGEAPVDIAGRIFGRLANQEGRILLKLPAGMERDSYLAFKTFFRYEGEKGVGNCAACHTLAEFTDEKEHIVTKGGSPTVTPSLRNLKQTSVDVRQAIMAKIVASGQKQSGEADELDEAYSPMNIGEEDVAGLVGFIELLNDVPDEAFRNLILEARLLDTSDDIE